MCLILPVQPVTGDNMLRKRQYIKMLGHVIAVLVFLTLFCRNGIIRF